MTRAATMGTEQWVAFGLLLFAICVVIPAVMLTFQRVNRTIENKQGWVIQRRDDGGEWRTVSCGYLSRDQAELALKYIPPAPLGTEFRAVKAR